MKIMNKSWAIALAALTIAACGVAGAAPTVDAVKEALNKSDVGIREIVREDATAAGMVPSGYQHHLSFVIEEVAPRGGQVFICDEAEVCNKIKAYFDALSGLAGPHRYQSKSGRVVVQINSGVSQASADKIMNQIGGL